MTGFAFAYAVVRVCGGQPRKNPGAPGKLPFSQFQHRVYYKAKDVKALADGLTAKSPKSEETEVENPSK